MKKTTVAMFLITGLSVLFAGSAVYGFDHKDIDTLMETHLCARCDLSGANLIGITVHSDLDGSNLSGADLRQSDLSGTDASGANFSGANLKEANLAGADFSGTDLTGADLTGANVSGTDFSGAKLDNAVWTDGQRCKTGSIETCDKEEKTE